MRRKILPPIYIILVVKTQKFNRVVSGLKPEARIRYILGTTKFIS